MEELNYMREAIMLARQAMSSGEGKPFGALVVREGEVIGKGHNISIATNDPTAHAEVTAIRDACKNIGSMSLENAVIYTSCYPCPMCLGAIYWSGIKKVVYACTSNDAADAGFDDRFIYEEIQLPENERIIPFQPLLREEALSVFEAWKLAEE